MVDFRGTGRYQLPSRKPLPSQLNDSSIQPLSKAPRDHQPATSGHDRNMSAATSLNVLPHIPPAVMTSMAPATYQVDINGTRRTPSNATSSTAYTAGSGSRYDATLRRSTSSRSGSSTTPSSYVLLMRKQKATVWCDRAQHEDPRLAAQQKAAKIRATLEVVGGNAGRTSTLASSGSGSLGVRSKIRHHGLPKATGYSYSNPLGGGVPMRLSASEVEANDDNDADGQMDAYHRRTGSGRSSLASSSRLNAISQRPPGRYSQGSNPGSGHGSSPGDDLPELAETPVPGHYQRVGSGDYFTGKSGNGGSGSSSEREAGFGNVGSMSGPTVASRKQDTGKSAEELRRRGSVDERAQTMTGAVRLFVANPDLSD